MKREWWSCDGKGHTPGVSRRAVLAGASLGAVGWLANRKTALADMTVRVDREASDEVLVVVFLRGGADALNVMAPYRDDHYRAARPSLALAAPGKKDGVFDLDGFFGLHPSLAPLLDLYKSGEMACVHAVGSADQTRSHFEAMTAMEQGVPNLRVGGAQSGWLARHLNSTRREGSSPLRAVALSSIMPDSLRGGTEAIALESLDQFKLTLPETVDGEAFKSALAELYSDPHEVIAHAGHETLKVIESLNRLDAGSYKPANGAMYPDSGLGQGLSQAAFLIKAKVGLEIAALDMGGWDTHVAQGGSTGWQAGLLDDLAKSVRAFMDDLGPEKKNVTVLVMTEFGRRLHENSGLGTDHGRGGFMFLLGGGVRGGRVYTEWPGLGEKDLEGTGDLRVTTDYRNVLAEVLTKRMRTTRIDAVFPGLQPSPLGLLV